ncbi:GtrA family protein, partial [Clostridium saudiense]
EITTVYIESNKSSHFNPISDSIKIYFNILKFSLSSLLSSALDIGVFTGLIYILHMSLGYEILVATILARIISGTFNFVVNKLWVFSSESKTRDESVKYIVLFISIMLC